MQRLGVAHSCSQAAVSNDNPYAESLFKTSCSPFVLHECIFSFGYGVRFSGTRSVHVHGFPGCPARFLAIRHWELQPPRHNDRVVL